MLTNLIWPYPCLSSYPPLKLVENKMNSFRIPEWEKAEFYVNLLGLRKNGGILDGGECNSKLEKCLLFIKEMLKSQVVFSP